MESLDQRIRELPAGKALACDGIPYEFFKYGPHEVRNYLLAAAKAFMSGSHPLPKDWLGGLVTLIPMTADAMTMKKFKPIANLSTSYKLCVAEIAERFSRSFEEVGVWHDCQEGGRRGRFHDDISSGWHRCWSKGNGSGLLMSSCSWTSTQLSRLQI